MPVGTIDPNEYERKELTTLPPNGDEPGGFIMVRPLPYGMKLSRRDKATRMQMEQQVQRPGQQKNTPATQRIEISTLSELAALFDFSYCIGEHNITDSQGNPLDFTRAMTLKSLNPKLGTEIEVILAELNGDNDEESEEDFTKQSTTYYTDESREASFATILPEGNE